MNNPTLVLVPIPKGLKKPVIEGWQKRSPESLRKLIKPGCNIGVRHDFTAVIDPDSPEAGQICDAWEVEGKLPETVKWITAAGNIKRLYKCPPSLRKTLTIKKLNLQLRTGSGLQDVIPPSYVKNPEKGIDGFYKWVPGHDPESIEIAELPLEIVQFFKKKSGNGNGSGNHHAEPGGNYEAYAQKALADELAKFFCQLCREQDYITQSKVVDIVSETGWRALCLRCHGDVEQKRRENRTKRPDPQ
jgi:hypothetical protein